MRPKTRPKPEVDGHASPSSNDLSRIEFHRHGIALLPDPLHRNPGVAFFLKGTGNEPDHRICFCTVSRKQTCPHILRLIELYKDLVKALGGKSPQEAFRSSIWYRLAGVLADGSPETIRSVQSRFVNLSSGHMIEVLGRDGNQLLTYFSQGADASRLLERLYAASDADRVPARGVILDNLAGMTLTHSEHFMRDRGFKTLQQVLEESFWYRFAYHAFREFGADVETFVPGIEEPSGTFTVSYTRSEAPLFRMAIPRNKVKWFLTSLKEALPNQHGLAIHPVPLKSIFKISENTELDIEIRPLVQVLQKDGETKYLEREDLESYRYGDLVYVKELGILAELEPLGGKERRFTAPVKMLLKRSQVPSFLQEYGGDLLQGPHIVDAAVKRLKIYDRFDRIEAVPEAMDRDWYWLSVRYGFGNLSISLAEILRTRKEGERYIATGDGWIDCRSPVFDDLDALAGRMEESAGRPDRLRLLPLDLLRLKATSPCPLEVEGNDDPARLLDDMLNLRPARPLPKLEGLTSALRPYQKLGVEWLLFLFENRLGGLLCDDMGLGKTHQVMALMLVLRDLVGVQGPFLVVCPTTVLSHWHEKMLTHTPSLKVSVFHGERRNLTQSLNDADALITSYGVLRNDIEALRDVGFSLAVFDEIQQMKNPQTLAYGAAGKLAAGMKLGLTGTPIENRVGELKALFDLVIPGYLGSDDDFAVRYAKPIESDPGGEQQKRLSRLISPFTLRRLKSAVLTELPEKIEDVRTCILSEDQVKLYRDTVSARGKELTGILQKGEEPVPYIHVFALLNLLKQICNHPALVAESLDGFEGYQSGKWDLFKELVAEGLASEQKIVVYSQFLGMIEIMERYLQDLGVGFVVLTGKSRNRGKLIARFNEDPDCRVFVGSLKAGGIGIDLVAASIVIHYDRWWNAAKEDQATDRVHRIGQRRGVQVFKLVTEGTLEEKIAAIIEKKRMLTDGILGEDDPGLLKTFSREDLIEMLAPPA